MKKILASFIVLCFVVTPAVAGNKYRKPHNNVHINGNHSGYRGGHNHNNNNHINNNHNNNNRYYRYNENNYYNYNNDNFYNNPYFWGGVAGGLIGGAIINGIDDEPYCEEVVTQVYVEGVGYRQGTTVVCD